MRILIGNNSDLFALGVTNKFAGLLLNVTCGARGLIQRSGKRRDYSNSSLRMFVSLCLKPLPANLLSLSVAGLDKGLVALLDSLLSGLLLECDLASLFKVLFAHFLLGWLKLSDVLLKGANMCYVWGMTCLKI
jgi:hypothetical protein